ncbi:hypothetical protein ACFOWE_09265 [Planomonospora corallina]|uniref:Uncharacterized protein n=1 Tax=Planomonospora corallina TaxID=1806052 RepID=A0ABV8I629_9ACTN
MRVRPTAHRTSPLVPARLSLPATAALPTGAPAAVPITALTGAGRVPVPTGAAQAAGKGARPFPQGRPEHRRQTPRPRPLPRPRLLPRHGGNR